MSDTNVPVVSVCCTTYQHVHFIRQAIEGFLFQRTSFPIEIIIRDDASTDGTAAIVKEYAERHPDLIHVIMNEVNLFSKGVRAMPDAMRHARGKYIAICEGDDYWTDPLKLQKQVDALESDPSVSMVFHNVWIKHDESRKDRFMNHGIKKERFTLADVLESEWFVGTCSMVYRQSAMAGVDLGAYSWSLSGDMVLQYHLALKGDFLYLDELMGVYRRHAGGVSDAIWNSVDHHFERFLPAQIWLLWRFKGSVHDDAALAGLERRTKRLLRKLVRHVMDTATDSKLLSLSAVGRRVHEMVEKCKPSDEPHATMADGAAMTALIRKTVESGWSGSIRSVLERRVHELGLWSSWQLVLNAVLREGASKWQALSLMAGCLFWMRRAGSHRNRLD